MHILPGRVCAMMGQRWRGVLEACFLDGHLAMEERVVRDGGVEVITLASKRCHGDCRPSGRGKVRVG
jgi:hypothetical protein